MRPRLLDLFCCQGGAGMGYHDAGFDVVGVDIEPQPRYPFEFIQADALIHLADLVGAGIDRWYDAIHASPPCQARTKARKLQDNPHVDLVAKTRDLLEQAGLPNVIENVPGETDDPADQLRNPVLLCGTMFGLPLYRHRLFECSFPVTEPLHGQHYLKQVKMGRPPGLDEIIQPVGNFSGVEAGRRAMQMPWASQQGLREAVPPAYTRHIGEALLTHLTVRAAA